MVQYDARGKPVIASRFSACERTTVVIRAEDRIRHRSTWYKLEGRDVKHIRKGVTKQRSAATAVGKHQGKTKSGRWFRVKYDIHVHGE